MTKSQPVVFRYLTQEDVVECGAMDMGAAVADMEEVFRLHSRHDDVVPGKLVVRWGDVESEHKRGRINAMPGYIGGRFNVAGIKWIGSFPSNLEKGLPRASAVLVLNDPETGLPTAIMDGTVISAMRTGAVTGVAAKYLAKADSKVCGLIGAGVQSKTQLMALKTVLPRLERALVYDVRRERAHKFADEMSQTLGLAVEAAESALDCCTAADVLVTATTTNTPIVKKGWLRPGTFYSHVGSYECEFDVILSADKVFVDDWEQVKHRAAQTIAIMHEQGLLANIEPVQLGDVVTGRCPGREDCEEVIFFNPVGMGVEDLAIGSRILKRAVKEGIGRILPLWESPALA